MWTTKTQARSAFIAVVLGAVSMAVCAAERPAPHRRHGNASTQAPCCSLPPAAAAAAAAAPTGRPLAERGAVNFAAAHDERPAGSIGAATGYARLGRFRCWVAVRTYLLRQFPWHGG